MWLLRTSSFKSHYGFLSECGGCSGHVSSRGEAQRPRCGRRLDWDSLSSAGGIAVNLFSK